MTFGKKAAAEPVAEAEVVSEKPAKAAKATKGKAVAVAAKSGTVLPKNALSEIGHEIENFSEEECKAAVVQLSEAVDQTFLKLGGVLSRILENHWYKPYASFREFTKAEYDIEYRTAMYWINIYTSLIEAEIPYEKVTGIGWSKLKELAGLLTPENVDDWVKLAKKNSVPQLIALIDQSKKEAAAGEGSGGALAPSTSAANIITNKTFKLHADQKETVEAALEKAKKEGNTTVDTVALDYLCLAYLNQKGKGKVVITPAQLKAELAKLGPESALTMVSDLFPELPIEADFEAYAAALEAQKAA